MSKNALHRHYDRLTPEERFRLDVLAMARGDSQESERLTNTCPKRDYIMNDWGFVGRWEAARELAMLTYMDFGKCLDKIQMIEAFRVAFPYFRTVWENDTFWAYFDGHEAGSRHAWREAGNEGAPPGYEEDEDERVEGMDPAPEKGVREWAAKVAEVASLLPARSTEWSARWLARGFRYGRRSSRSARRRWRSMRPSCYPPSRCR
jgi:hypothetical protein